MNTQTKTAMLAILCIGMLTALTLSTLTLAVNPAFAKKKHCDKTDNGCDTIKAEKKQDDSKKTIEDEAKGSINRAQAQVDNSTLPIDSLSEDPFAIVGITGINSTTE